LAVAFAQDDGDPVEFEWKTHDMGLPLVDLEDKDALYRILDEG
jgi:hypothetical protein